MMSETSKHPGKTAAQRRVLDEIGCGNHSPIMGKVTRNAMLTAGLIYHAGYKTFGTVWSGVRVEQYDMPINVHYQWCQAMADTPEPEQIP